MALLGAYLLGSVCSAILVSRVFGLCDPREGGSGNPGATNVLRIGGKAPAFFTLGGDFLKGWLSVFLFALWTEHRLLQEAVLLAAVCGHIYPVFFGFKGGKGVATALGGVYAFSFVLGNIFVLTWLGVFALFRYSSLAALVAVVSMPLWAVLLYPWWVMPGLLLLAALIVWQHWANILRLCQGTESKSTLLRNRE